MRIVKPRGSKPRISVEYTDPVTKLAIDPDHVSLFVKDPARTETEYVYWVSPLIVRDSQGHYHADVDMSSLDGDWQLKYVSTGAGQAVAEITIHIMSTYDGET